MGAAIAAYYGRPDARSEMMSPELADYSFEASTGETTTWTVARRVADSPDDNTSIGNTGNPYDAILKARTDLSQRMTTRATEMTSAAESIRNEIDTMTAQQELDRAALNRTITVLTQIADQIDANLLQQSQALQKASVDSKVTRDEVSQRREDVLRLQNELEEIRTDIYRLVELRRDLTDQLVRLQLDNQSLEQRKSQLVNQSRQ